jgi:hypothetical protein
MKNLLRLAAVLLMTLGFALTAQAEEKNGLSVSVTKRTLNRSDRRDSFYYTRYDRTQGYKVTIRNTSLKPLPEGEVNWTILVRKMAYTNRTEKFVGTEKLQALRPSESVELMVGAVPIEGYRYERDYKDEMEYEIAIVHGGKETYKTSSKGNFAALTKGAVLMKNEEPEENPRGTKPAGTSPAPATRPATPAATRPAASTTPAAPPTAPTAATTRPVPATPRVTPATPPPTTPPATAATTPATGGTTPPADAPADSAAFDFFNLNKKKPGESK